VISLLITLVVIGVIVYLVTAFIPMDAKIAQLIRVVAIIIAVVLVLQAFGLIDGGPAPATRSHFHLP
jgi:hypothetical protein